MVMGFPDDSDGKESACNAGDPGSIPGLGSSLEGNGTHSSILAWKISRRNLVASYSPWGCKDLDTTDQLTHRHGCKTFSLILIRTMYYSSHISIEVTEAEKIT